MGAAGIDWVSEPWKATAGDSLVPCYAPGISRRLPKLQGLELGNPLSESSEKQMSVIIRQQKTLQGLQGNRQKQKMKEPAKNPSSSFPTLGLSDPGLDTFWAPGHVKLNAGPSPDAKEPSSIHTSSTT